MPAELRHGGVRREMVSIQRDPHSYGWPSPYPLGLLELSE
jgi:hypothetical protein